MLKKNKRQIVGQSWLIVVRLPEQMFNCIQLLIVLPSAQKQTGRERTRLGDVAELKNVKLEPMMHKVTNDDCYY
jgi:hypothetical protein